MKRLGIAFFLGVIVLGACVTINVYFPAAAAQKAAQEFVGDVLGENPEEGALTDPLDADPNIRYMAFLRTTMGVLSAIVPEAHAQADIDINTPQINAIKARMAQRQRSSLKPLFDSGAIGFTKDGFVAIRDRSAVGLAERRNLESVVADENRDRRAVYREIAVANGHPEWESDIQETFAREWIKSAQPGWQYEDSSGNWKTK